MFNLLAVLMYAGLMLFPTGCMSPQKEDKDHPASLGYGLSDDDLSMAVCNQLCGGKKFPQYDALGVWISHNYDQKHWEPMFREEKDGIDKVRKWAGSLPNCPLRREYMWWLDYYENDEVAGLKSARDELYHQTTRKEMDAYNRENDRQRQAIEKTKLATPKP